MKAKEIFNAYKANNEKAKSILQHYYKGLMKAELAYKSVRALYLNGAHILEEEGLIHFTDTSDGLDWLWNSFPFDLTDEPSFYSPDSFATSFLNIEYAKELIESEFNVELSYE